MKIEQHDRVTRRWLNVHWSRLAEEFELLRPSDGNSPANLERSVDSTEFAYVYLDEKQVCQVRITERGMLHLRNTVASLVTVNDFFAGGYFPDGVKVAYDLLTALRDSPVFKSAISNEHVVELLIANALRFILYHELSHFWRGHFNYRPLRRKRVPMGFRFSEGERFAVTCREHGIPRWVARTFEMDADVCAIKHFARSTLWSKKSLPTPRSRSAFVSLLLFSVGIVHYGIDRWSVAPGRSRIYPDPLPRLILSWLGYPDQGDDAQLITSDEALVSMALLVKLDQCSESKPANDWKFSQSAIVREYAKAARHRRRYLDGVHRLFGKKSCLPVPNSRSRISEQAGQTNLRPSNPSPRR